MLGLSKKTDYALLALSYLAEGEPGRAIRTREIAEQYDIPVELLAKILQKLARARMLVSTPGPTGGYILARPSGEISVGAVVKAVEGAPALIHCIKTEDNGCEQLNKCTIRKPLTRINARVFQMLDRIPLSEINDTSDREETVIYEGDPRVVRASSIRPQLRRHREPAGDL